MATAASGYADNQNTLPRSVSTNSDDYYYPGATSGTNGSAPSGCPSAEECKHYKGGVLYNWSAAVASNNSTNQTANYAEASNSICPVGWKLPAGMTSSNTYTDFNYLLVENSIATNYVSAGSNNAVWKTNGYYNIQASPLYIVRSGYFYNSRFGDGSASGLFWSSTSKDGNNAYAISYSSGGIYPAYIFARYGGFAVRCLVRE